MKGGVTVKLSIFMSWRKLYKDRLIFFNPVFCLLFQNNELTFYVIGADTSRHYLPLPVIKKVIDSMSYAKLVCNALMTNFNWNISSPPLFDQVD